MKKSKVSILTKAFVLTMLLASSCIVAEEVKNALPSPSAASQENPVPLKLTDMQQLQMDSKIKDFQILQLQFMQLVQQIKQTNSWGDDVTYDAQQNHFYRMPKSAAAKQPQSTVKPAEGK